METIQAEAPRLERQAFPAYFEKPTEDYLRVMTASPEVTIADPVANVTATKEAYASAIENEAELLVLPELNLTGYSTADLFHNEHILETTQAALCDLAEATVEGPALIVGAPLVHAGKLYNCAAVLAEGAIQGVVPKTRLPNYGEFYEKRWFSSGRNVTDQAMAIGDAEVPFGTDLLFDINGTKVGIEICEDAWAAIPPSSYAALAGAEVIVNLSASNELIGKKEFRQQMAGGLAGRLLCAYVYTSAGKGESNADVIYGGHQMIFELGHKLEERTPHDTTTDELVADIDRQHIQHDRLHNTTFADEAEEVQAEHKFRTIPIHVKRPDDKAVMQFIDPLPFVPANPETLDQRCSQIMGDLAEAFAERLEDVGSKGIVLGLSGGLDSTLGILIAAETAERLGKTNDFINTITMPGPASSERTQDNATVLANALGTTHLIKPIGPLTELLLETIDHDGVTEDITFENTQARIRTTIQMNYANKIGGMVQGTGDMSEIMQGWSTYNGDHMSMFNPNSGVPKTLVRHLVRWYADRKATPEVKAVLDDILDTPVSPELTGNGALDQTTDSIIGPDELRDFFTYHHLRYGSRPQKLGFLAAKAFAGKYDDATVSHWLQAFLGRHTSSQWKREAVPNGTKIGTIALSPRGDLRMAPNTGADWWR